MFRRLADRVSSAVASVAGSSDGRAAGTGTGTGTASNTTGSTSAVGRLTNMGFSSADAQHALQVSGGNVEQAAEWLLSNANSANSHSPAVTATTAQTEEDELQKAISASLMEEANARNVNAAHTSMQSAAAKRAGQAALSRFDQAQQQGTRNARTTRTAARPPVGTSAPSTATAIQSHPNVKIPKRLSQHDTEKVIMRCAQRVAPNAAAVDTLLKSLKQLQANPTNLKFRTVDTSTPGFKRSLDAPGTVDFFKAMGYHTSHNNNNLLELSFVDPATLYLGISALEQVQLTSAEYQKNKTEIVFDREIKQILVSADQDMEEALRRSQFISKLPSEPTMGGGIITVELGASNKIQRKFDGDDCLQDILNWLGANGSVIPGKLEQKTWFLVDRHHSNSIAYNVQDLKEKTLQYIGCWPSARLAVVPEPPNNSDRMPSSSRGLGAAPIEALRI
jgi:hypothetical protein